MKVKILASTNLTVLEESLNEFIKDKNIFMVTQSQSHGHSEAMIATISVWYEEE